MKRYLLPAGILLVLMLVIAVWVINRAHKSVVKLPELYSLPEFGFVTEDGQTFDRTDLIGKISVIDFIYTSCPGPCPMMSSRMARFYEAFQGVDQIRFISISVDPARDSLSVLRAYADKYGVKDDRWVFLRGEMDAVIDLYEKGFKLGGLLPVEHSTKFILVDERGIIRGYYDSRDEKNMAILNTHLVRLAERLK